MWQKSLETLNSLQYMVSHYLCEKPNQIWLDEHPLADPPVLPIKFEITNRDEPISEPEQDLQEVTVEVDKPIADYTARDWFEYFKKVDKVYWLVLGAIIMMPILVGIIACCCMREPKTNYPLYRGEPAADRTIMMNRRRGTSQDYAEYTTSNPFNLDQSERRVQSPSHNRSETLQHLSDQNQQVRASIQLRDLSGRDNEHTPQTNQTSKDTRVS